IISISDLREEPQLILYNTEKNISAFRHSQLEEQLPELKSMFEKFEELQDIFIEFNTLREKITESLNVNIGVLNKWNHNILSSRIVKDEDLEVSKVIFANLIMRK